MPDAIEVRNARVHNLRGISLDIPRDRLVVFTGVSGSGKSSLVFDTLHTEAQRQLLETFSSFSRRYLPKLSRPDVDEIRNLGTSIVIDQKRLGRTLRSTVGTATEVYTYLRMLYSRCGDGESMPSFFFSFNVPPGWCEACQGLGKRIRIDVDRLLDRSLSLRQGSITHPDYRPGGWGWTEIVHCGLFDADKRLVDFTPEEMQMLLYAQEISVDGRARGLHTKKFVGLCTRLEKLYAQKAEDETAEAERDAYQRYLVYADCDACGGLRLNPRALAVRVAGKGIGEAVNWELTELDAWLATIEGPVAAPLVTKMRSILGHLLTIGVGYLSLHRSVATLSGGESQRVKMARQLDCDLTGLMYVLDEPSIGLHPRDIDQLITMLRRLRDKGNSVLVVEHDPAVIRAADHVVEIGPGAGRQGGELIFDGPRDAFLSGDTLTAELIREADRPVADASVRRPWTETWAIRGARLHNLQDLDVDIPRGILVAVTGVAGSGKSTLVHDVFVPAVPGTVVVDQTAIGQNSRSNPATYLGFFDEIRKLFGAETGKPASLFSFNSAGACPTCKGAGSIGIEMSFLDAVRIECSDCEGRRYRPEVLQLRWHGLGIDDVLRLTAREAREVFDAAGPKAKRVGTALRLLCEVGLDYVALGQPLSTLSGGECQRLKLATELGKSGNVYVLDEPTTGLHLADIDRLMSILERLVDTGNSVIVIEHNLQVVAQADWVIDLGPEGGHRGGRVVAVGTPEDVAASAESQTGRYLRPLLDRTGTAGTGGGSTIAGETLSCSCR
jgi:excinuclease UvrABC ATPase subunit